MQNVTLNHGSVAIEPFFDATQELLSGAAPRFRLTIASNTAITCAAGTGDDQQSIALDGRYRFRTTAVTASIPAGDGVRSIYVTGSENAFTGPPEAIDATVYDFGLQILASGTPGTAIWRKVGEVDVTGGVITGLRHWTGDRRDDDPIQPQSQVAQQHAIRARGATGQTAAIIQVESSTGGFRSSLNSDGGATYSGEVTITSVAGLTLSGAGGANILELTSTAAGTGMTLGGDVNLYRAAANSLVTDDSFTVGGNLAVTGTTTLSGTPVGPTAAVDTSTTQLATTAYVVGQGYLKAAAASGTYAPLASPALTGTPTAPTAAVDTNTTQLATTAFVMGQGYLKTVTKTYSTPHTFSVYGEVRVPSGDTDYIPPFFVVTSGTQTCKFTRAKCRINSGTSATISIRRNGTEMTGANGVVTPTGIEINPADVTLADGDLISVVVTAVSGTPKNLTVTVALEHMV